MTMVGGPKGPVTVMVRVAVVVPPGLFVAEIVTGNVPPAVGVPVITPRLVSIDKPGGSPVAA